MEEIDENSGEPLDIFTASSLGDIPTVTLLLNRGKTLNHANIGGWTPLMYACFYERIEMAQLLIDRGADRNFGDPTPLMIASCLPNKRLLELIIDENSLEKGDAHGLTALYHAIYHGQDVSTEFLLQKGANPNARAMGTTPLIIATNLGHTKIAKMLLSYGADKDFIGSDGCNAYQCALYNGRWHIVRLLQEELPDLEGLLLEMGLEKYWNLFQKIGIDLKKFMCLTEDDMKEMGIMAFGPRRKMVIIIRQLQNLNSYCTISDTTGNLVDFSETGNKEEVIS